LSVLSAVLVFRIWVSIIEGLTASSAPGRRITGLRGDEARFITLLAVIVMAFVALTGFGQQFVLNVADAQEAGGIFALAMRILGSFFLVAFFIAVRKPVARLILLGFANVPDAPGMVVSLVSRFGPDQDLEKVRKLIKRVGQDLLEDPDLEGQFLAPLKSQGAVALVGSNYQIGVKFTSEPGKQFLIRRKALNAIQTAFQEDDIEMSPARAIVDSGGQTEAAAAKVVADAQAAQTGGT
jgi:hypothetical protein